MRQNLVLVDDVHLDAVAVHLQPVLRQDKLVQVVDRDGRRTVQVRDRQLGPLRVVVRNRLVVVLEG